MQIDFTPGGLGAQPGDITTWSAADFDGYEHVLEAANPAFARAAATGTFVIGLHAEGSEVVVDLGTADDLARRIAAGTRVSASQGTVSPVLLAS
ncbi:hypothetical protein ACFXPT_37030 [Streptomyces goshikiensis]|uniref:hypothetical protein n=1 Tax=Streptomyces goshikiensis TaxID=1942 RepID=UPI00367BC6A6